MAHFGYLGIFFPVALVPRDGVLNCCPLIKIGGKFWNINLSDVKNCKFNQLSAYKIDFDPAFLFY
jgi:hypothetical protein